MIGSRPSVHRIRDPGGAGAARPTGLVAPDELGLPAEVKPDPPNGHAPDPECRFPFRQWRGHQLVICRPLPVNRPHQHPSRLEDDQLLRPALDPQRRELRRLLPPGERPHLLHRAAHRRLQQRGLLRPVCPHGLLTTAPLHTPGCGARAPAARLCSQGRVLTSSTPADQADRWVCDDEKVRRRGVSGSTPAMWRGRSARVIEPSRAVARAVWSAASSSRRLRGQA